MRRSSHAAWRALCLDVTDTSPQAPTQEHRRKLQEMMRPLAKASALLPPAALVRCAA